MITIISAGDKTGGPPECHIHMWATAWPNPPKQMRYLTGQDAVIADYVIRGENPLVADVIRMAAVAVSCREASEEDTVVGITCNYGTHRSVAGAENLGAILTELGYEVQVIHRDLAG